MSSKSVIPVLRSLLSEYRQASSYTKLQESPLVSFILQQYKKYKVTDQQLCKAQEEMNFIAESYLCYLKSQRCYEEKWKMYHAKGERSVRDTADLVGFKLPHDPK
ncbi:hypothetical protein R5R35_014019 [Gryllus longicercus]|uniref:Protein FMC1 homolog n=1 Tax=Gryllus longicercus TaxID=2509291 RepID=A0AAN9VZV1_9ORTH